MFWIDKLSFEIFIRKVYISIMLTQWLLRKQLPLHSSKSLPNWLIKNAIPISSTPRITNTLQTRVRWNGNSTFAFFVRLNFACVHLSPSPVCNIPKYITASRGPSVIPTGIDLNQSIPSVLLNFYGQLVAADKTTKKATAPRTIPVMEMNESRKTWT